MSPPRKYQTMCEQCGSVFFVYIAYLKKNGGKFCSKKCYAKYRENKPRPFFCGDKSPLWSGDKPHYITLHWWIGKVKGKAKKCKFCESTKWVEWASKNHQYLRDPDEYISLCRKCHRKFDAGKRKTGDLFNKNEYGFTTRYYHQPTKKGKRIKSAKYRIRKEIIE